MFGPTGAIESIESEAWVQRVSLIFSQKERAPRSTRCSSFWRSSTWSQSDPTALEDDEMNYSRSVYWDAEGGQYLAVSSEFPSLSAFGETPGAAFNALGDVIEAVLEVLAEEGEAAPTPAQAPDPSLPSGEFRVRIPRTMHAALKRKAEKEGVSQNHLVTTYVAQGLAGSPPIREASSPATFDLLRKFVKEALRGEAKMANQEPTYRVIDVRRFATIGNHGINFVSEDRGKHLEETNIMMPLAPSTPRQRATNQERAVN